ncbi:retinol-binding protein 5-like [Xenopus laevis]|uniref:Retinol-binding protein 5-like n=1 Tax=Xenopus laevis TaxID=8355 RepID=A0A8J1LDQ7_XENLA|nr:retinol-binding protein 5-like [Xenopus laevis]
MTEELKGRYVFVSQDNMGEYFKALILTAAWNENQGFCSAGTEKRNGSSWNSYRVGDPPSQSCFRRWVSNILDPVLGYSQLVPKASRPQLNVPPPKGKEQVETTVTWENGKLVCVQRGDVPKRGWKQWLDRDLLHVELTAKDVVSKQTFRKVS